MTTDTMYVRYVRHVVGVTMHQWEAREDGDDFNKHWEVHEEAAEGLACAASKHASAPDDVPSLTRDYFVAMAGAVRADMAANGRLGCEATRKSVAARALQQERGATDPVKLQARYAAASLLIEAGDEWVPEDPTTTFAGVRIGGQFVWDRIVATAQVAANGAFVKRTKSDEVPALFGAFFWRFMRVVRTRRRAERRSWGETRTRLVAELLLPHHLPKDPLKAAAYATAALLLETIPFGAPSSSSTFSPTSLRSVVVSLPQRALASPAAAPSAVEITARRKGRKASPSSAFDIDTPQYAAESLPPATADVFETRFATPALGTPPPPTTPMVGRRPPGISITKGYGPNLLNGSQQLEEHRASPDNADASSPPSPSGGQPDNTSNATAASAAIMMPPPAGMSRTPGANPQYGAGGFMNAPTRGNSTNNAIGAGGRVGAFHEMALPMPPTISQEAAGATVGRTGAMAPPDRTSGNFGVKRLAPVQPEVAVRAPQVQGIGERPTNEEYIVSRQHQGTDTEGAGRSGASIAPGAAPAMAVEPVGVASGVTARSTRSGADQGVGALGAGSSGSLPSQCASETAEDDDVDWDLLHEKLESSCPEVLDFDRCQADGGVDTPSSPRSPKTSGPGGPDVYAMAVVAAAEAAASAAAAERAASAAEAARVAALAAAAVAVTPSPAVAGAEVEGAGATTAAGTLNHSRGVGSFIPSVSAGRETMCHNPGSSVSAAGSSDVSGPTDGDGGRHSGNKRKPASSEGDSEDFSPCDGGPRKKPRSG